MKCWVSKSVGYPRLSPTCYKCGHTFYLLLRGGKGLAKLRRAILTYLIPHCYAVTQKKISARSKQEKMDAKQQVAIIAHKNNNSDPLTVL